MCSLAMFEMHFASHGKTHETRSLNLFTGIVTDIIKKNLQRDESKSRKSKVFVIGPAVRAGVARARFLL